MDKKPNEIHENLIPTKINNLATVQQKHLHNNKHKHNTIYNWPAFLAAS